MQLKESRAKINYNSCLSLMKLLNSQYWNNAVQWFYDFIFSVLLVAFMGYMYQSMSSTAGLRLNDASQFKNQLIGLITLQIIGPGCFSMPASVMEIKTSVLMKRIGSTPVKPWMFILTATIYYFFMTILISLWIMLWVTLLFGFQNFEYIKPTLNDKGELINNKEVIKGIDLIFGNLQIYRQGANGEWVKWNAGTNWFGFIIAIFYSSVISISLGLLNISLSKTTSISNIIGTALYFSSMFLSGMLFPLKVVVDKGFLNAISYITPFRYANTLSTISWLGHDIFNPFSIDSEWLKSEVGVSQVDVLISFIIPAIIIGICAFITIKFFKWNTR